jgi:hypothetical protein
MATFHPRRGSDEGRRVALPAATSGSGGGDRTLGPDEEKMLRLVSDDDPVADELFCQKAVERLVLAGKLEEALHFADASLPNGAPDFLLRLLVEKAQDKSTIWQHIVRITDPDVAAHMVLRHLQAWPLDVCLELLGMCRDRVSPSAPTAEEVERQYRQLSALRDVLQVRYSELRPCAHVTVVLRSNLECVCRLTARLIGGGRGKTWRRRAENSRRPSRSPSWSCASGSSRGSSHT